MLITAGIPGRSRRELDGRVVAESRPAPVAASWHRLPLGGGASIEMALKRSRPGHCLPTGAGAPLLVLSVRSPTRRPLSCCTPMGTAEEQPLASAISLHLQRQGNAVGKARRCDVPLAGRCSHTAPHFGLEREPLLL
jgi:hypothetical protein